MASKVQPLKTVRWANTPDFKSTQAGPLPKKVPPRAVADDRKGEGKGGKVASAGNESGTQSKPDLQCRDPTNLNDHVKVHTLGTLNGLIEM